MRHPLKALWERPITSRERWHALTLAALTLITTGTLLSLTTPHPASRSDPTSHAARTQASPHRASRQTVPPAAARAARVFLTGYLAYTTGHTPASQIRDAAPSVLSALQAQTSPIPPAARAHRPRVIALRPVNTPSGIWFAALVNDGTLIDYPIGVQLGLHGGRWLVARVVGE